MVINVISEYPPNTVGGGGILAEELVKRLLERGHVVNVITWGKPSVQKSKLHPNLTIYKVCQSGKVSPIQKLKFGYLAGRKAKDLKGIIHGHIFFFPLDKKRTIYTFHLTQLGEMRALQKIKDKSIVILISIMLKKLYLIWEKYIIRNSLKLIAVSNTVKNELLELGAKPEQIEIIPNSINLENYYRASPKIVKQLRARFATNPNNRLIFAIGRLLPRKGFQYLIRAVTLLKDKNIKLLIAGEGGYRQTLEQLSKDLEITNQVIFLGKIPKDEVKNFYSSADVTVVPSLYEPFGLVVLEAMACGSPLVCSKVCDFPLIAGKAALYAQPQNPKDLAKKIQDVLNHPEKAKKKTEYGLKKVKNYAWQPYIEKLEKIYTKIDQGAEKIPRRTRIMRKMLYSAHKVNNSNILGLLEKNETAKLLDLGCDDGAWTLDVTKKSQALESYGLDIVDEKLKEAQTRGLITQKADLNQKFPHKDNFFDCVHSRMVIEHLHNTDNFISEIFRVLKKEGYCVVSTENLSSWCNIFALVLGWQPFSITNVSSLKLGVGNPLAINRGGKIRHESWKHVRVEAVRGLKELFEIHGFKVEKLVGAGYFPLPAILGKFDVNHSHFITIKARKP